VGGAADRGPLVHGGCRQGWPPRFLALSSSLDRHLLTSGVPMSTVSAVLGHVDIRTTVGVYGTLEPITGVSDGAHG